MSGLLRLLAFFIWGGLVPSLCGLLPASYLPANKRRPHLIIVMGYFCCFALFELIGLPVLFFWPGSEFAPLLYGYTVISVLLAAAGILKWKKDGLVPKGFSLRMKKSEAAGSRADKTALVLAGIFLLLLVFQLYKAYTCAYYDGDDAYYVAQSLQTYLKGNMYRYVPYTGESTVLDGRHAMALIPMWITAIARLTNTHPTIITHSMIPLIFIPLSDLCVYSLLDEMLYKEDREKKRSLLGAGMIMLALFQIFGNVSIYTPETFLLTRTWQGKTVFTAIVIPACLYCLLIAVHALESIHSSETGTSGIVLSEAKGTMEKAFAGLAVVNIVAGFCTSLAPFYTGLIVVLTCGCAVISFRTERKGWLAFIKGAALSCIPSAVYALIVLRLMLIIFLSS